MILKLKKKFLNLGFTNRNFGKKVIHVEAIYFMHEKLKAHLKKYNSKCYCIGPSNYEYSDSFFGVNMSKKKFRESLKKYYLELKKIGVDLQMHVHLAYFPKRLPYKKKREMIKSTYDFFVKDLEIIPKEIVFGWYRADEDARKIASELNLRIREEHLHIYDWWL